MRWVNGSQLISFSRHLIGEWRIWFKKMELLYLFSVIGLYFYDRHINWKKNNVTFKFCQQSRKINETQVLLQYIWKEKRKFIFIFWRKLTKIWFKAFRRFLSRIFPIYFILFNLYVIFSQTKLNETVLILKLLHKDPSWKYFLYW